MRVSVVQRTLEMELANWAEFWEKCVLDEVCADMIWAASVHEILEA